MPFKTLFAYILSLDDLTKDQLTDYLTLYHASYNEVTLEDLVNYILEIDFFTSEEQINCIWTILSQYPLDYRIAFILDFHKITYRDYIDLFRKNQKEYSAKEMRIIQLFKKVNLEKEAYILKNYAFESKQQLDEVVAGGAAEGANSYDDLYCVANVFFNRITHPYYAQKGENPYFQFIEPKQFSVYGSGSYLKYLYPLNYQYDQKYQLAKLAFYDMFYLGYVGIVHNYTEFRSWDTFTYSDHYVVSRGNRYGNPMSDTVRIQYEQLQKEDENSHILTKKLDWLPTFEK